MNHSTNEILNRHWARVRAGYRHSEKPHAFSRAYRRALGRYYRHYLSGKTDILEVGCGEGGLMSELQGCERHGIDLNEEILAIAQARLPDATFSQGEGEICSFPRRFEAVVLSDTLNESADVQMLLKNMHKAVGPDGILVLNVHNTLWRPVLKLAEWLRLRPQRPPQNWLSGSDVANLLDLAGWEIVRKDSRILIPFEEGKVGEWINRYLAPFFPWFCLSLFFVAKPRVTSRIKKKPPTVSVIIPARNEKGNIAAAVERIPPMGFLTEIIFVEGHSSDGTWEAIREMEANPPAGRVIRACQQTGKGKGDAMRLGYEKAKGDILMILDADLTVPPEDLPKFYDALVTGTADFANGVRLVYPKEDQSMRFLNMCGNKGFSLLFSWILGFPIKDTLCGTKVFWKKDYLKIAANRTEFGDFDPFGDFDLIFGAAKLNLQIRDIPIRYQSRAYGETQINRWRDGWLLLRMAAFAAKKFKFL